MRRLLGPALAVVPLFSTTSAADPLALTSGLVLFQDDPAVFLFTGDNFDLSGGGVLQALRGTFWRNHCKPSCAPGTTIDFGTTTYGLSDAAFTPSGFGEVHGVTYPQLFYAGEFTFTGPEVVTTAVFEGPLLGAFAFRGQLFAFTNESRTGTPVFAEQLRGVGTARVFAHVDPDTSLTTLEDLEYTFTPIPEPSTLLLLGSGFVVAAKTLRQRRSL
jgi:hypothetical protein